MLGQLRGHLSSSSTSQIQSLLGNFYSFSYSSCWADYVDIYLQVPYHGYNLIDTPLFGRFCGHSNPLPEKVSLFIYNKCGARGAYLVPIFMWTFQRLYSGVRGITAWNGGRYLSVLISFDKLNIWNISCSLYAFVPEFFGCYGNQNYFFEHL